ncbi:unnamed protein product [Tenebrio molitor]|nr:unnamed protein product [Tenebrio molitor]
MVSNKCCVSGCSSSRKNGFKLFYVPNGVKNRVRREQWLKKLRLSTNLL